MQLIIKTLTATNNKPTALDKVAAPTLSDDAPRQPHVMGKMRIKAELCATTNINAIITAKVEQPISRRPLIKQQPIIASDQGRIDANIKPVFGPRMS
jgi:hypothetical protein